MDKSASRITRVQLDNGLTILLKEAPAVPIVSTMIWYRVGSRNEEPGQTGKSHFLEHMLFKGTHKLAKGQIDQTTLRNGGANNAFTSEDYTAYYFDFASDRWEVALDIEADRMVNTRFDPAEYEQEKRVVIEELKMNLDSPWGALQQEVLATAFKVHPYRNPVVGWIQDLERASVQEMEAYYRRFYHPNHAVVVVVGDIESARALEAIRARFEKIPRGPDAPNVLVAEPPQQGEKRVVLRKPTTLQRIDMMYHAPRIGDPDGDALRLLSILLTGGKSSRLNQRLVEKEQRVTLVVSEYAEAKDPFIFELRAELKPAEKFEEVERAIDQEIARLQMELVPEAELQKAKNLVESYFVYARERTLMEAIQLGHAEVLIGYEYLEGYLDRVRAVTAERMRDAAQRYLHRDQRTVGWLVAPENDTR